VDPDGAWPAGDLLGAAGLGPAGRVLDVGCGTGVVARGAAGRRPPRATVVALDPASLPFADASFDAVVCQQRLQLFPDRGQVLAEMWRVLVPRGRLAVAVWGPIERSPAFAALADALERHAGARVAAAVRWRFSLPEPGDLRACLAGGGFDGIRVRTARQTARVPSVAEFLRRYLPGAPAGRTTTLRDDDRRRVVADLERGLARLLDADGLRVTAEANIAVATR
jgi:SAM-dependent methyltransferase